MFQSLRVTQSLVEEFQECTPPASSSQVPKVRNELTITVQVVYFRIELSDITCVNAGACLAIVDAATRYHFRQAITIKIVRFCGSE